MENTRLEANLKTAGEPGIDGDAELDDYICNVDGRRVGFFVGGKPEPAGSKKAFRNNVTGRIHVTESNPRSKHWKSRVVEAAQRAFPVDGPIRKPCVLFCTFYLTRPKSHYGTGKNAGVVKASAPKAPGVMPDSTKLIRGTEDALQESGLVINDALIVTQVIKKRYHHQQGAEITLVEYVGG